MRIPAGEQARYVESAAAPQHSEIDKRELPGGGPQIRLMDYDPHWEIRRDQIGAVYSPDHATRTGAGSATRVFDTRVVMPRMRRHG